MAETVGEAALGANVTQPAGDPAAKRRQLKARLDAGAFTTAPGVFDLISARLADAQGPAALYMTGYGTVASHLGVPDAGLATYTDMVGRVAQIAQHTAAPLIADGDTGYGGLLNVQHTVRGYEQAGAAAIQLEDQEFPKKCGHTPGRRVVPAEEMAAKVRVAAESRDDPNFLIVARTDARATHGLDEALRRIDRYAKAGADLLFLEAPESEAEMERIGRAAGKPLVANMVEGGRTPILSAERLSEIGYRLAIFPATGFLAAARVLERVYADLVATGSSAETGHDLYEFDAFSRLMGFEAVWAFDRRHAADDDPPAGGSGHGRDDQRQS
jgi:2-methylisocitrate lyase-like PEP mutase family enzyme